MKRARWQTNGRERRLERGWPAAERESAVLDVGDRLGGVIRHHPGEPWEAWVTATFGTTRWRRRAQAKRWVEVMLCGGVMPAARRRL